jgi:hypothetical protein
MSVFNNQEENDSLVCIVFELSYEANNMKSVTYNSFIKLIHHSAWCFHKRWSVYALTSIFHCIE